jgi:hypothetical protein
MLPSIQLVAEPAFELGGPFLAVRQAVGELVERGPLPPVPDRLHPVDHRP